jgi:UTP--glucose-1-phosphate uridylyltransferase
VLLPDMVTKNGPRGGRCLVQCVEVYDQHGGNVMAVEEVPAAETHQYGIVAVGQDDGRTIEITGMVEKPKQGTAPSNLIISGRYVLQPEIFQILELVERGAGGEVQLTGGLIQLARTQSFHGVRFDGRTYDCGSRLGLLSANLAFALDRSDMAPGLKEVLRGFGFVSRGGRLNRRFQATPTVVEGLHYPGQRLSAALAHPTLP